VALWRCKITLMKTGVSLRLKVGVEAFVIISLKALYITDGLHTHAWMSKACIIESKEREFEIMQSFISRDIDVSPIPFASQHIASPSDEITAQKDSRVLYSEHLL
jgi:hypothetical protein